MTAKSVETLISLSINLGFQKLRRLYLIVKKLTTVKDSLLNLLLNVQTSTQY